MNVSLPGARSPDDRAHNSEWMDHAVRVGLVSYGVVHLILAWLALRLAFGDGGGNASNQGALHQLAQSTLGRVSLYVVAAGFVALVVWQALEAAFGHRDEDGGKRVLKRVTSAGKVVLYGSLAVSAFKTATGGSSGGGGTKGLTGTMMSWPAGPLLVGLVAVGILVVAGFLVHRGWTEKFRAKLDFKGQSGKDGRTYIWLGQAGYIARVSRSRSWACSSATPHSPTTRRSPVGWTRRCTRCSSSRSAPRCSRSSRPVSRATGCSASPGPGIWTGEHPEHLGRRLRDRAARRPRWHLTDVDAFFDIYRRWEVARWLGSEPRVLETLDEAEARVTRWSELNRSCEDERRWAVERREDGRVIGTVLLVRLPRR